MKSPFGVGDIVVCVDALFFPHEKPIIVGNRYIVKGVIPEDNHFWEAITLMHQFNQCSIHG